MKETAYGYQKSELYSSLWASCDELRGGMDGSQYKDYVLFMLFIKYVCAMRRWRERVLGDVRKRACWPSTRAL